MTRLMTRIRAFRRSETGTATIEFAIIFPFFMMVLTSGLELGVINLRQVALDSRVESAMRVVRINTGANYTADDIRDMICTDAPILGDCTNNLRIQMEVTDPRDYTPMKALKCLHTGSSGGTEIATGPVNFNLGNSNELVLVRACLVFNPILPSSYLSAERIAAQTGNSNNLAALTAMTAFTQEPR